MRIRKSIHSQQGFSLIEILLTISLMAILMGFMTMNLLHAQQHTTIQTIVDTIASDLRSQQTKAMNGVTTTSTSQPYGIHVEPHKYILFQGPTYSAGASSNYEVILDDTIELIPSPAQQIIFSPKSGETGSDATIKVVNTNDNEQKTVSVNSYGVITSIQ